MALPCAHLGDPAGGFARDRLGLDHRLDWRARGRGRRAGGYVCRCSHCKGCPDYRPDAPDEELPTAGPTRHVLYHCLPARTWGHWRRTADKRRERASLCNGRKVAAVLTDAGAGMSGGGRVVPGGGWDLERERPSGTTSGAGWDVFPVPNDPALREVATWVPLWERLADLAGRPGHAAFYAHSKGVRHAPHLAHLAHLHDWARAAMDVCLAHWPHARRSLAERPIAGPFQDLGRAGRPTSQRVA